MGDSDECVCISSARSSGMSHEKHVREERCRGVLKRRVWETSGVCDAHVKQSPARIPRVNVERGRTGLDFSGCANSLATFCRTIREYIFVFTEKRDIASGV